MTCPFDIDLAMFRIREAVRPFPQAALFELASRFRSPFESSLPALSPSGPSMRSPYYARADYLPWLVLRWP